MVRLFLILIAPTTTFAEGFQLNFYDGYSNSYNSKPFELEVMPKEQCVSVINNYFQPEEMVKAGIASLQAIQGSNQKLAISCLDRWVKDWGASWKVPNFEDPLRNKDFSEIYDLKKYNLLEQKYRNLRSKLECTSKFELNSDEHKLFQKQKVSYGYCTETFDKSTRAETEAQLSEAQKEFEIEETKYKSESENYSFTKGGGYRNYLLQALKKTSPQPEELKSIAESLKCYNRYSESQDPSYFKESEKYIKEHCPKGKISKEKYGELSTKQYQLNNEWNQKNYALQDENYKLQTIVLNPFVFAEEEKPEVQAIALKIRCRDPKESTSNYGYGINTDMKKILCNDQFTPESEYQSAVARLKEIFGDANTRKKEAEKRRLAWEAEKLKLLEAISKTNQEQYILRRLVNLYYYSVNHGLALNDLSSFCEDYERRMRRDQVAAPSLKNIVPLNAFTDKNWKAAFEFGLTETEYAAVIAYTGNYYKTINSAIWSKSLNEDQKKYQEILNDGLRAMPKYSQDKVIRFSDLPQSVLEAHAPGKVVCYDAFTSTSSKQNWSWQSSSKHKFIIYPALHGHDVDNISANSGEMEVLFESGSCFLVLRKETSPNSSSMFQFTMVEATADGKILGDAPKELFPTP